MHMNGQPVYTVFHVDCLIHCPRRTVFHASIDYATRDKTVILAWHAIFTAHDESCKACSQHTPTTQFFVTFIINFLYLSKRARYQQTHHLETSICIFVVCVFRLDMVFQITLLHHGVFHSYFLDMSRQYFRIFPWCLSYGFGCVRTVNGKQARSLPIFECNSKVVVETNHERYTCSPFVDLGTSINTGVTHMEKTKYGGRNITICCRFIVRHVVNKINMIMSQSVSRLINQSQCPNIL